MKVIEMEIEEMFDSEFQEKHRFGNFASIEMLRKNENNNNLQI